MVYTVTRVKMVKSIGRRVKLGAAIQVVMAAAAFNATGAWAQAAGSLDTTFGTGGTVTTTFTGNTLVPHDAVERSNGDIVVLSQFDVVNDVGTQIGLTWYTSSGVLDTTFGTKGSTFTAFSSITFDPFGFTLDANGNILVAGIATTAVGVVEFGLARFTANGVLDTTFGTGGVAATQVGTRPDAPSAWSGARRRPMCPWRCIVNGQHLFLIKLIAPTIPRSRISSAALDSSCGWAVFCQIYSYSRTRASRTPLARIELVC